MPLRFPHSRTPPPADYDEDTHEHIRRVLLRHMARLDRMGNMETEGDLITWYLERIEHTIETQAELLTLQYLLMDLIEDLVYEGAIVQVQPTDDPLLPERRLLGLPGHDGR